MSHAAFTPARAQIAANALRVTAAEVVERAQSGHPGAPMGLADAAVATWHHALRFDPSDLTWSARDRFVLSCGHASALLYTLLYLYDAGLTRADLESFRQLDSRTPGHPEAGFTPGVEVTTGPLGHGCATSVGLALAARVRHEHILAAGGGEEHPWRDARTVVFCSDGDLMEGVSYEAAALAGHWGLGELLWVYDDNRISIDGDTALAWSEDVAGRFGALGWRVERVDGHDPAALAAALGALRAARHAAPTLLICRTQIGYGSPKKANTSACHGSPLGAAELAATRAALGWAHDPFALPEEARAHFAESRALKVAARAEWERARAAWAAARPAAARVAEGLLAPMTDADAEALTAALLARTPAGGATRKLSNAALKEAFALLPRLVGGSADLSGSNGLTFAAPAPFGDPRRHPSLSPVGRQLHFGIREHAMGAVVNGLCLGGLQGFCGTFLVFSDYLRPTIRVAALSHVPSAFVLSHDSVFLGEDGPTHQPVEHAWALRLIPGCEDWRPADGVEVAMAWAWALTRAAGPTAMMLTRQDLPALTRAPGAAPEDVWRGGYVLEEAGAEAGAGAGAGAGASAVTLIGTGSEVSLCVEVAARLRAAGRAARVVSMPSVNRFLAQDAAYRDRVLGAGLRVSVEAGSALPWRALVGLDGLCVGIDTFGASAPMEALAERFGLTPAAVTARVLGVLEGRGRG
ncbi:MAG: transketolase [Deltaproteobacteria bacterium]|nr:transketolase [Deltaproteobacteria bacterium]